ncbi:hypothetical protein K1719_020392 [Acacia pycnantha]|nr:hypothetical protein K1719_020392 [Acacia pycnantha]
MVMPQGDLARYYSACEKDMSGFVYHCRSCGYDLHLYCTKLPMEKSSCICTGRRDRRVTSEGERKEAGVTDLNAKCTVYMWLVDSEGKE